MAKKKSNLKKSLNKYTGIVLLALIVITIIMAFIPNVVYSALNSTTVSGFNVMFGWATVTGGGAISATVVYSNFSFMAMLAYVLPIVGLVLALIFKDSKLLSLIPIVLYLVSAIFLFVLPSFVIYTEAGVIFQVQKIQLGAGAIIAGICSLVAFLWLSIRLAVSCVK